MEHELQQLGLGVHTLLRGGGHSTSYALSVSDVHAAVCYASGYYCRCECSSSELIRYVQAYSISNGSTTGETLMADSM